MVINPYLNFNGNTEEVFNFYKAIFGGEFSFLQRFSDVPSNREVEEEGIEREIPSAERNGIMHVALPIGQTMLMGTDVPSNMEQVKAGTNTSLCLSVDSRAEADHIFNELAVGGSVQMHLQDTFWGDYYGMLTDKYGIQWMISYNTGEQQKVAAQ